MSYKRCEICGLRSKNEDGNKRTFMARYPLDPVRCKSWVKATGKEDLAYIPIEKLHQLKFLCKDHFSDCHFNKLKNRLKRNAVPSINLREKPLSEEVLMEFPCYLFKEHGEEGQGSYHLNIEFDIDTDKRHYDHNYCKPTASHSTLLKDSKSLADNEDSRCVEDHLDADDVTATTPPEFSWQRPPEAIPCADDVGLQTDVSLTAPDSAGSDGGDDRPRFESHNERLHPDCKCNECGSEIIGYRYTCVQCCDVELCGACEASGAHPEHYVLRLPRPEPAGAVKGVLETLRGLLDHLVLHNRVKKEEIDEEDPLSIEFVPPEPASSDKHNHFESEEIMEEESFEEITLPFENRFPLTDFTLAHEDTISHFPADTVRIRPQAYEHSPDMAHIDVKDCPSMIPKYKNLSEVIPILNNDSIVRPCEQGTKTSGVWPRVATSVGNVTWSGACVAKLVACVAKSGACVTKSGACVTKSGACVAKSGACVTKSGACVTKSGACVAKSGACVTKSGACVTKSGACVAKSRACVFKSGACVTKSGACATVSGAPTSPPELVVKKGRLDNQIVYEALAAAKRKGTLVATVTHRRGQINR